MDLHLTELVVSVESSSWLHHKLICSSGVCFKDFSMVLFDTVNKLFLSSLILTEQLNSVIILTKMQLNSVIILTDQLNSVIILTEQLNSVIILTEQLNSVIILTEQLKDLYF